MARSTTRSRTANGSALFRDHDLAVEDLLELRAPKRATSTYADYVDHDWARRWPAEEIWKVRKL